MNILKAIEYIFSSDSNWSNQALYCVKLCKKTYIQQMLVTIPWVRKTTSSKFNCYWMAKNVAEHVCKEVKDVGYFEAKVEKVHWWNIFYRGMKKSF